MAKAKGPQKGPTKARDLKKVRPKILGPRKSKHKSQKTPVGRGINRLKRISAAFAFAEQKLKFEIKKSIYEKKDAGNIKP